MLLSSCVTYFDDDGCLKSFIVDLMLLYSCDCPFWCRRFPLIYDCGFNVAVFLCLLTLVPRVAFNL